MSGFANKMDGRLPITSHEATPSVVVKKLNERQKKHYSASFGRRFGDKALVWRNSRSQMMR
jgi:hypothetical protein